MYALEQGLTEDTIIRKYTQMKQALPAAIANAPDLIPGLGLYYEAFWSLDSCRINGMGRGRIPWTATLAYVDEYGILGEQRDHFFALLTRMDGAFLKYYETKDAPTK